LRAAVTTPPEPATVVNLVSVVIECCLIPWTRREASGFALTGLARRSIPAARSVAPRASLGFFRRAPRRAFATPARSPSFIAVVPCYVEIFIRWVAPPFFRSLRPRGRRAARLASQLRLRPRGRRAARLASQLRLRPRARRADGPRFDRRYPRLPICRH